MRIAIGGLAHETNTFSTVATRLDDFGRAEGEALIAGDYWRAVARRGHELLPLFTAHASPSGCVTRAAFESLLAELLDGLERAMPLDGVLLVLHGAMVVEEIGDGETAILVAVRRLIGSEPLIATTLDLHASLSPSVVAQSDLITGYRTAPHRDMAETCQRGMDLLIQCLERGVRPMSYQVKLPLLLAGEAAVTEVEPTRSLYARLPQIDRLPSILVSSILIGCAWTDSPYTAVSVVLSGTDAAAVRVQAEQLAAEVWAARERFAIDSPTAPLAQAVAQACAVRGRPVFVSDSGDNSTAGAAGDLPIVLAHLLAADVSGALVAGITDPEAVAQCFLAGEGATLSLSLGGKLDRVNAQPYGCQARVLRLHPQMQDIPPRVLVRVGGVDLVLQADRRPFTERRHFYGMGLDPAAYRLVVVKQGYLFPELRDLARAHVMALTPGFADQCLERLAYQELRRPVYPLDPNVQWVPAGV